MTTENTITDYSKRLDKAECDKILSKALYYNGITILEKGIDVNTTNGIDAACAELVEIAFGKRGYFKDINLLEVLDGGNKAKYSIFIGVEPTKAMKEFNFIEPIGVEIYITTSK